MRRRLNIFDKNPIIEGENIILRKICRDDIADMYEYSREPETSRYLLWSPHPSIEYTAAYIESLKKQYKNCMFFDFAIILKNEGKMVGTCGFTKIDEANNSAEIGYVVSPKYWHRGIATEAVALVLRLGFCDLHFNRIEARYMAENIYSRAVMEKSGMVFEGIKREGLFVKGSYRSIGTCSLLRREFIAKNGGDSVLIKFSQAKPSGFFGLFT